MNGLKILSSVPSVSISATQILKSIRKHLRILTKYRLRFTKSEERFLTSSPGDTSAVCTQTKLWVAKFYITGSQTWLHLVKKVLKILMTGSHF